MSTEFSEIKIPVSTHQADELVALWETVFPTTVFDEQRPIMAGEEQEQNYDVLYVARKGKRLVGSTHLTIGKATAGLGGLGEVAVLEEFRGEGLATELCGRARDRFRQESGVALFLGTDNPVALRVYHRLEWKKIAATNVMAWMGNTLSPEEFLTDYFRHDESVVVVEGTAADRLTVIPLLVTPHDEFVLDANLGLFSTRYALQKSCMGLYPKFQTFLEKNYANWFVARTEQGRAVGLSTVRLDTEGRARLDGMTHKRYSSCLISLLQQAIRWATDQSAVELEALIAVVDTEKASTFEALGFCPLGSGEAFELDGNSVASTRYRLSHSRRV